MNYTIPQTLLDKVKRAMRMEEIEFNEYLISLEQEALAYIESLIYADVNSLNNEVKKIMISFYIQYALYSKLEKDEISQDKLNFLDNYIAGYNDKLEKETQRKKIDGNNRGVKIL